LIAKVAASTVFCCFKYMIIGAFCTNMIIPVCKQ
jgi:hypothetical protein